MQNVLIVGAGSGGTTILNLFLKLKSMNVKAIVDKDEQAPGLQIAREHGICTGTDWKAFLRSDIHIVFDVTGDDTVFSNIMENIPPNTLLIPGSVANVIVSLLKENGKSMQRIQNEIERQRLIFNSVDEGMIGIGPEGNIDFINESACRMLEVSDNEAIGKLITDVIPQSKLVRVLESGTIELNEELILPNGTKVVTSRYPLASKDNTIIGAFAVFKDVTEVTKLAEEITGLKQVKTMLEAIIQSSDDAISVVDENGIGVLVNRAYTRMTGLTQDEIIGKPATVDINEGESIHMKVLETKQPVRGVNMKIGEDNRDVIVNVAPIIVNNQLKGSVGVIHDITEIRKLMKELDWAKEIIRQLEATYTFADIHGNSADIHLSIEQAKLAAKSDIAVLLRGEAGTGKELFANAIHSASERKSGKFIRVNCGAIDSSLMEKELFGEGEVTGDRIGLLKEAINGTLFLDEVTALTKPVQIRLFDYINGGRNAQLESQRHDHAHVRIIAATSKNLERAIHEGSFNEELYYALNRLSIHIPPLRSRKSDITEIVNHLLVKLNQEFGMNVEALSAAAKERLRQHDWPGNVRELENVLSRAMIYMKPNSVIIDEEDIKRSLQTIGTNSEDNVLPEKSSLTSIMDDYEKSILEKALEEHDGNKSLTANRLGISLRSLYYKMEKHKLI